MDLPSPLMGGKKKNSRPGETRRGERGEKAIEAGGGGGRKGGEKTNDVDGDLLAYY